MKESAMPITTDPRNEHPAAPRLDALAAGDEDSGATEHIAVCEACARYVRELAAGAESFRATADGSVFVAQVQRRMVDRRRVRSRDVVVWLAPLAVAAAGLLFVRARPTDVMPGGELTTSVATSRFKGAWSVAVIRERGGQQ